MLVKDKAPRSYPLRKQEPVADIHEGSGANAPRYKARKGIF
jgi:hypothetical protein